MSYWEIILLCLALSMNILAVCSCTGTKLPRLVVWKLALACPLLGLIQCLTLDIGDIICHFIRKIPLLSGSPAARYWVSAGLFLILAISLFVPAILKKPVLEKRLFLNTGALLKTTASTAGLLSINSLLTGIGVGAIYDFGKVFYLSLFVFSVLSSLGGVLVGYFFGYEHKTKAFWVGGALFLIEAVAVVLRVL